jgi:hypothetical protein
MREYVRVRQSETGHHLSITRANFERAPKDAYTELSQPAADLAGNPLPPKYKTTVSAEAEKKAGTSAAPQKENSR